MDTAPRDGTLLLLLIEDAPEGADCNHGTEDEKTWRTLGFFNDDTEWLFAGWDWCGDVFTQGHGTPIAWQHIPAKPL